MKFDNTFVVAHLAEVKEDGVAPLEQIVVEMEMAAKQKKKGEQISKEMEGETDMQKLAEKIGVPLSTNSAINFASYSVPGIGQEPRVIGVTAALNKGEISKKPVIGGTGVFMILVEEVTLAPETADYTNIKQQLNSRYASVASGSLEALKDKYGVVDLRYKFY
jgi:peptidyl-prolyl cis-trans isomerase D